MTLEFDFYIRVIKQNHPATTQLFIPLFLVFHFSLFSSLFHLFSRNQNKLEDEKADRIFKHQRLIKEKKDKLKNFSVLL